jgi:hypothetical protein
MPAASSAGDPFRGGVAAPQFLEGRFERTGTRLPHDPAWQVFVAGVRAKFSMVRRIVPPPSQIATGAYELKAVLTSARFPNLIPFETGPVDEAQVDAQNDDTGRRLSNRKSPLAQEERECRQLISTRAM